MNSPGPGRRGVLYFLEQKEGEFKDIESSRTRLSGQDFLECLDFGILNLFVWNTDSMQKLSL